jgi:hydroxyacylglutathione hydrolase
MAKHLMMFEQFSIGGRNNLAYIVGDARTGEAAAIDVGFNPDRVVRRLAELGATLKYVLATHGHRDHIGGAPKLKASTGARFAAFRGVAGVDEPLDDGAELHVGDVCIRVIHCPNHSISFRSVIASRRLSKRTRLGLTRPG